MYFIAQAFGVASLISFIISYQQKTRNGILFFNIVGRVSAILQFLFLKAYPGMVMNFIGIICALTASKKEFFKNKIPFLLVVFWIWTVGAGTLTKYIEVYNGVSTWSNFFFVCSILGMGLQGTSLWLTKPKSIRFFSLAGSPLWLIYNLINAAWAGAACDIMGMVSIVTAMIRLDIKKEKSVEGK